MQRKTLLIAALLAAGLVSLHAQQGSEQLPLYRGTTTHVDGVFVTPVAGAPFSATVMITSEQLLADGTMNNKRTVNIVARDSRGRIHNERRVLVPQTFQGMPRLLEMHIFDPQTRLNTYYDPATRIARQQILRELPKGPNLRSNTAKIEDLGPTTLNGMDAKGLRRTYTVPAQSSGTGAPVEVVDEYWYSEDLQINLLIRHTDPRTGVQTVAVSNIKREEPPPALFELPEGTKLVDMNPPIGGGGVNGEVFGAGTATQGPIPARH
jgi:hypothetical protein